MVIIVVTVISMLQSYTDIKIRNLPCLTQIALYIDLTNKDVKMAEMPWVEEGYPVNLSSISLVLFRLSQW